MAFFNNLKLDPNFEQWLDQRILKLKAEGALESDPEGEESEQEFIWGEEPTVFVTETELRSDPGFDSHDPFYGNMASSGLPGSEIGRNIEQGTNNSSEFAFKSHITRQSGTDYYQFTWEDDEEADVFDREAYQLGHNPITEYSDGNPPFKEYRDDPTSRNNNVTINTSISSGSAPGDTYSIPEPKKTKPKTSRLSQLGGLVLGIGQRDIDPSYTKLQSANKSKQRRDNANKGTSDYLPDPRFSISDEFEQNNVQMLELRGETRTQEPQTKAPSNEGRTQWTTVNGSTSKDRFSSRIILPSDVRDMNMSSDDEDILAVDEPDSELAPDTQTIVTVDQATLVQQWQTKSKKSKTLIILGIVGATVVVFSLVVVLVVELLKASW